ncbi:phosphatase PAP2 family protein [Bacillus aquiflavi]|nr:phosphatase PAP2 family protein [Bacillus aquiflavi]
MNNMMKKKNLVYLGIIVAVLLFFIILFILLVNGMKAQKLAQFDQSIISFVQQFVSPSLTNVMKGITFFGSIKWLTTAVIVIALILFFQRKFALGLFVILASGFGAFFNRWLKWLFKRERPDIFPIIEAQGFSFPSGHSMGAFIFYSSVAYLILHLSRSKVINLISTLFLFLFIIMIGLSRIYLGVHFPSDVVSGFVAGGAWLLICILIFRFYKYRKNR